MFKTKKIPKTIEELECVFIEVNVAVEEHTEKILHQIFDSTRWLWYWNRDMPKGKGWLTEQTKRAERQYRKNKIRQTLRESMAKHPEVDATNYILLPAPRELFHR